jgi:hypothetical protein
MKIKIKNLYLGLKDQMPISRFAKNLYKGHVFGLFSIRSHERENGTPKVKYNTKATAKKSAESMMKKNNVYYSTYKCIYCDGYHIGRNRENKTSNTIIT